MIQSIKVTNYLGKSLEMILREPEKSGFVITKIKGLGPSKSDIKIDSIATSDISLFNSSRIQKRNIVITFRFLDSYANDKSRSIEDVRLDSYAFFPVKRPITITVKTDNKEAYCKGYVESNTPDIFSSKESTEISIICPDPFFYDVNKEITVFSGVVPEFEFPFENNSLTDDLIELSEVVNKRYETVYYSGDIETGVIIKIHAMGTVENINIYNLNTREVMSINTVKIAQLTGYGLIAGDDIIISTVQGDKYITLLRNGNETNLLNCLDRTTDWFTIVKGDNVFAYTADVGASFVQFSVETQVLYEGV